MGAATATLMTPWDVPAYTSAETGRLVGLRPSRVRRWLRGYEYNVEARDASTSRRVRQVPVIHRVDSDAPFASFLDLVDLLFVKKFLEAGISLQKLRRAMEEADTLIGGHHFAQRNFFTEGHNIYMEVRGRSDALLELLTGGQWVIAPVIRHLATEIKFHDATGFASNGFPSVRTPRSSSTLGFPSAHPRLSIAGSRPRTSTICTWRKMSAPTPWRRGSAST